MTLKPCPEVEALFWNKPNVWYPKDLSRCPFCGESAVASRSEALDVSRDQTADGWWYYIGCHYIGCPVCPETLRKTTPAAAITAWNTRKGER